MTPSSRSASTARPKNSPRTHMFTCRNLALQVYANCNTKYHFHITNKPNKWRTVNIFGWFATMFYSIAASDELRKMISAESFGAMNKAAINPDLRDNAACKQTGHKIKPASTSSQQKISAGILCLFWFFVTPRFLRNNVKYRSKRLARRSYSGFNWWHSGCKPCERLS